MNRAERRAEEKEQELPSPIPKIDWDRISKSAMQKSGLYWVAGIVSSGMFGMGITLLIFAVDYTQANQTILSGILTIWAGLVLILSLKKYHENISIVFGKRK